MSAFIPWAVLLGLAAVVARYLRREGKTHRKLADQQQATLGEVLEELTSLRSALLASGTIERSAKLPPPSPVPPQSQPRSLPVRVVPVTRDDEVVHTRETKVQPAADALVDATRPNKEPPSSSVEIRARFHAEADEKDKRDGVALDATLASAVAPETIRIAEAAGHRPVDGDDEATVQAPGRLPTPNEDEDERTTDEGKTKLFDRRNVPTKRPPPHKPPRKPDPLAGVPTERPVSSASRTAARGRRPTLLGGLGGAPKPPKSPELAKLYAETPGEPTPAVGAGFTPVREPTPTEPGAGTIDARIERRWSEKVAAAQAAGKDANHCHSGTCLENGRDVSLCECGCDGCRLVVALHVQAAREIRAEDDWGKP